jgi:hypothetical protein
MHRAGIERGQFTTVYIKEAAACAEIIVVGMH